tara:strand:- start:395 stop:2221 length:1827 start_codon:yes stop_codon:yes gene_type:complete
MSTGNIETSMNWCSEVDSPTYKLTWYIVNHEVFNNPLLLDNNAAVGNKKATIIASSGETSEYSVENLILQSRISPGTDTGNTTTGAFQFDVYEPGGFQLMNRILQLSHLFKFTNIQSAKYVLKVEFIGRNVVTSAPESFPGVFYYPMMLSSINASAGPDGSQYNIVAANQHKIAVAASKIVTDIKVTGVTNVEIFLDQLQIELNNHEQNIRKLQIKDTAVNAKQWNIKIDKSFEKYLKSPMEPVKGSGHDNDMKNPVAAYYTLPKAKNVVEYLVSTLTKQVPDYYNTFAENTTENNKMKQDAIKFDRGRAHAGRQDIYVNDFIKVTPTIKTTDKKDIYTNSEQELIELTISLYTSHTVPQSEPYNQQSATIDASYQSRRLELLPINKAYSFLFSGDNSEVLDFNLNFNHMFYLTRDPSNSAGYTKITKELGSLEPSKVTQRIPTYLSELSINNQSPNTQIESITTEIKSTSSKDQANSEEQNASNAIDKAELHGASMDFISFDVTIKGDPYWLGTPGSYVTSKNRSTLIDNLDEDSLIIFINYLPDNGKTQGGRKLDIASSGVYKIIEVESKFQLGKFTQTLKGMRDRNSSTDLIQKQLIKIGLQNGN